MHEWALADGVVRTALEAGEKEGLTTITRIAVRIGELQRIGTEVFRGAIETVLPRDDARLADVRIELEVEPARFRCRPCHTEFGLRDMEGPVDHDQLEAIHFVPELAHAFMACPACHSPDFEVVEGRGVWIEAVEGR